VDKMAENNKSSIVWQFFKVKFLDASKAEGFGIRYSHSIFDE